MAYRDLRIVPAKRQWDFKRKRREGVDFWIEHEPNALGQMVRMHYTDFTNNVVRII